ncbi:hypothetical protein CPB83DRAFT_862939, partial [Crepidotus variabilis]
MGSVFVVGNPDTFNVLQNLNEEAKRLAKERKLPLHARSKKKDNLLSFSEESEGYPGVGGGGKRKMLPHIPLADEHLGGYPDLCNMQDSSDLIICLEDVTSNAQTDAGHTASTEGLAGCKRTCTLVTQGDWSYNMQLRSYYFPVDGEPLQLTRLPVQPRPAVSNSRTRRPLSGADIPHPPALSHHPSDPRPMGHCPTASHQIVLPKIKKQRVTASKALPASKGTSRSTKSPECTPNGSHHEVASAHFKILLPQSQLPDSSGQVQGFSPTQGELSWVSFSSVRDHLLSLL